LKKFDEMTKARTKLVETFMWIRNKFAGSSKMVAAPRPLQLKLDEMVMAKLSESLEGAFDNIAQRIGVMRSVRLRLALDRCPLEEDVVELSNDWEELPKVVQTMFVKMGRRVLQRIMEGRQPDLTTLFCDVHDVLRPYLNSTLLLGASFSDDSKDEADESRRKNHLVAIVSVCWALNDLAVQQGDNFERGSFTVVDPNRYLYEFFLSYVRLVTNHHDPAFLSFRSTSTNFAYRRDPESNATTHHRCRCPESQFGIDVRFHGRESIHQLLPHRLAHLLFASLRLEDYEHDPHSNVMFLKFESVGMGTWREHRKHAMNYLASGHGQSQSESLVRRRESDIDKDIALAFEQVCREGNLLALGRSVRQMCIEAKKLEKLVCAKNFLDIVNAKYPNDKRKFVRCGNEVVLYVDGSAQKKKSSQEK
jgi:hypothetical protein